MPEKRKHEKANLYTLVPPPLSKYQIKPTNNDAFSMGEREGKKTERVSVEFHFFSISCSFFFNFMFIFSLGLFLCSFFPLSSP